MTETEYEALERFSIMTESNVDEVTALKYIQSEYGRDIAVKLWEKYCK